jgi:hypothetical protein
MPPRDESDFWVRFETSDIRPTEADLAERERREAKRNEAAGRIKADLRRFVQKVNESFAVAVRVEFTPGASGRMVIGRDGVDRQRQKFYAVVALGHVDAMAVPSDAEAAHIGEILAADVRSKNPTAAVFGYVGGAPIGLLGERFGSPCIQLMPTVDGLHGVARLGMYVVPLAVKETP